MTSISLNILLSLLFMKNTSAFFTEVFFQLSLFRLKECKFVLSLLSIATYFPLLIDFQTYVFMTLLLPHNTDKIERCHN